MQEPSRVPFKPERPAGVKKGRYFAVYCRGGGYDADLINTKLSRHGFFLPDDIVPEKLPLAETPRFRLKECSPEKPPRDFQQLAGLWFLSDRAKQVFAEADPGAFVFVRCETEYRNGQAGPNLWICNVIRVLDALDREKSQYRLLDKNLKNYDKTIIEDVDDYIIDISGSFYRNYLTSIIGDAKIFCMKHLTGHIVCVREFKNICVSEKVAGVRFSDEVIM